MQINFTNKFSEDLKIRLKNKIDDVVYGFLNKNSQITKTKVCTCDIIVLTNCGYKCGYLDNSK
jgi:hypothetical protein